MILDSKHLWATELVHHKGSSAVSQGLKLQKRLTAGHCNVRVYIIYSSPSLHCIHVCFLCRLTGVKLPRPVTRAVEAKQSDNEINDIVARTRARRQLNSQSSNRTNMPPPPAKYAPAERNPRIIDGIAEVQPDSERFQRPHNFKWELLHCILGTDLPNEDLALFVLTCWLSCVLSMNSARLLCDCFVIVQCPLCLRMVSITVLTCKQAVDICLWRGDRQV